MQDVIGHGTTMAVRFSPSVGCVFFRRDFIKWSYSYRVPNTEIWWIVLLVILTMYENLISWAVIVRGGRMPKFGGNYNGCVRKAKFGGVRFCCSVLIQCSILLYHFATPPERVYYFAVSFCYTTLGVGIPPIGTPQIEKAR